MPISDIGNKFKFRHCVYDFIIFLPRYGLRPIFRKTIYEIIHTRSKFTFILAMSIWTFPLIMYKKKKSHQRFCRPKMCTRPNPPENCFVAGWGLLYSNGPNSASLQSVNVEIYSDDFWKGYKFVSQIGISFSKFQK